MIARVAPLVGGVTVAEALPSEVLLAILNARQAEMAELALCIVNAVRLGSGNADPENYQKTIESWRRTAETGEWIAETEASKQRRVDAEAAGQRAKLKAIREQERAAGR